VSPVLLAPTIKSCQAMKSDLRVLLTNAFGLKSKMGELQHVASEEKADIVIVTETKFTSEKVTDGEVALPGFSSPIRHDRTAHGGGVAVWVRSDLAFSHLNVIDTEDHEVIWLSIVSRNGQKVVICALYRPGSLSGDNVELLEYLDATLESVRHRGTNLIIAGDFNVHSQEWLGSNKTTKAGEYTEDLCNVHGLQQHVAIPTRGVNTLDLVLSDVGGRVKVTGHPPIGASDHITVVVDFSLDAYREPPTRRVVWRYAQADWDRLRHYYRSLDWDAAFTDCPDKSCENITSNILQGMKRFIPSRTLISRPTDPVWWTPECTDAVNRKKKFWKSARKNPSPQSLESAADASASSSAQLRRAQAAHQASLRQRLSSGNLNDKQWWSTIKQAGGQVRNTTFPTLIGSDGSEHVSNSEKANCFGQYFSSKCSLEGDFTADDTFPELKRRSEASLSRVYIRQGAVKKELRYSRKGVEDVCS